VGDDGEIADLLHGARASAPDGAKPRLSHDTLPVTCNSASWSIDINILLPRAFRNAISLATRASHFCYGKSGQNHCAGQVGFAGIVPAKLPLVSRRTAAAPNSHISVLKHAAFALRFGGSPRRHEMAR
jgi:hypothetical protein